MSDDMQADDMRHKQMTQIDKGNSDRLLHRNQLLISQVDTLQVVPALSVGSEIRDTHMCS